MHCTFTIFTGAFNQRVRHSFYLCKINDAKPPNLITKLTNDRSTAKSGMRLAPKDYSNYKTL